MEIILDEQRMKNFAEMKQKRTNELQQLEKWTGLQCAELLFDSDVDDWNECTSVFNERIVGKSKLVFLIEDKDGEIFGYYLNTKVVEKYLWSNQQETDKNSFEFNLQSHGRLKEPMKFEIKDLEKGGIHLYEKSDIGNGNNGYYLVCLGDIHLKKRHQRNTSYCNQHGSYFDYHGIEKALCGKTGSRNNSGEKFTVKRIVVIQMK